MPVSWSTVGALSVGRREAGRIIRYRTRNPSATLVLWLPVGWSDNSAFVQANIRGDCPVIAKHGGECARMA